MRVLCSPDTEDIETYIKSSFEIGKKPLHLVPTMILYRRRLKFYFSFLSPLFDQVKISSKNFDMEEAIRQYVDLFEVDQYIKHMIFSSSSSSTLSKSEATVILERIVNKIPETNNLGWKSIIYDLISTFTDFSLSGLNLNALRSIDNSRKWTQALDIYELYLAELNQKKLTDYGISANLKINELDVSIYDELILDGAFLPLSSKHQRIIDKFIKLNKPITIFLPYNLLTPDQPASKAIEDIYQNFLTKTHWESIQDITRSRSFFIDQLPELIFRDESKVKLDNSLSIIRFATLEEELSFIMQQIYVLIKFKEVDPRQVVIVTPNAMELRPLIREIAEQNNLLVRLPQRPFMHLAQGKAIKYLYDIRTDMRKLTEYDSFLNTTMFKNFISGTLINCNSGLSESFEKIESFFADCISIADWKSVLSSLATTKVQLIPEKYPHHPINSVELQALNDLLAVIDALEDISFFLVTVSARTVKEHVGVLIQLLQKDSRIVALEDPIFQRLTNITDSLEAQDRVRITSIEFGERISSLFSEQENFEDGDIAAVEEVKSDILLDREILVTGPNNVEFQKYEYVYVCRFTQDVYPEPKKFDWLISKEIEQKIISSTTCFKPQTSKELENFYLNRSLYHIHLMFCAAKTQLTVSYSQVDNGIALTPAHYLHDIAKVFGLEEGNMLENKKAPGLEELLIKSHVLKCPSSIKPLIQKGIESLLPTKTLDERKFTVEEVAIYKYCPRRFYYQKKYQKENVYSQQFHLQSYASSCLYEKSVELLVLDQSKAIQMIDQGSQYKLLVEKTKKYRIEAEKVIRPLFPLSNRIWSNVTSQTDFFLSTLMNWIFDNAFVREYRKSGNNNITIQLYLSNHEKEIKIDGFTFTATKELEVQYNHGEIHRYSISNLKDILSFSSNDQDEREHMKDIKDWYERFKRSFYNDTSTAQMILMEITNKLSIGEFPKNIGGHCKYCTFNKLCHEREVDI